MSDEADDLVWSIGRDLISQLAPEELALYPSQFSQFQRGDDKPGDHNSDQILGFGTGEVVVLMTPVILNFTQGFWDALLTEAAHNTLDGLAQQIKRLRSPRKRESPAVPQLTVEQLQRVRKVAEQQGHRMNLPKQEAALYADAIVGALATPPA